MTSSFSTLIAEFANEFGVDAEELARTQELIVDDYKISFYLDVAEVPATAESEPPEAVSDVVMKTATVVLFTLLGEADDAQLRRISRTLLEANNLWAGTSGCTLGLQRGTNQVMLCIQLPLMTLTAAGLAMVVNGFSETAAFWKSFVTGTPEKIHDDKQHSLIDRA